MADSRLSNYHSDPFQLKKPCYLVKTLTTTSSLIQTHTFHGPAVLHDVSACDANKSLGPTAPR